jgi:hypothetical protein
METSTGTGPAKSQNAEAGAPFSREEVNAFLLRNSAKLERALAKEGNSSPWAEHARRAVHALGELQTLLNSPAALDLEDMERRLSVVEDRLTAALTSSTDEETLLTIRKELDTQLAPYRRRMSAAQLSQLERQYMQKRLFEKFDLPRLSLFYLT